MTLYDPPVFKRWLSYSLDQLLEQYANILQELWGVEQDYADAVANESQLRYNEYFKYDFSQTTHQFRETASRRTALPASMSMHELDGKRKSLQVEKTFVEMVLRTKHNVDC